MSQKYLKLWIAAAIVAGLLCAVCVYLYQLFYISEQFLPGVQIANVKVQGKTRDDAVLLLKDRLSELERTKIRFYTNSYSTDAILSEICSIPDMKKYVNEVWKQEQSRSLGSKLIHLTGRPISYFPKIEYRRAALESLAQAWNKDLGSECQDARLEMDPSRGLIVIPEKEGRGVDIDGVISKLPVEWTDFSDGISVPIVINEQQPAVKSADLQGMGELSAYTTHFKTSEINRSSNLRRATASINGKMIPSGQEFSFNDTVGERTVNSGYSDAMVIVGDRFEPGLGGGVCQVSSTLYNAVLLAGLEIVERHNHNLAVTYVPQGLDATVSYGIQDFRFKNTSSAPVYIRAITDGGQLIITVYGNLSDKVNVKLSNVVDQVISYGETRQTDPSLGPGEEQVDHGGAVGYTARSFRSFYDANNNLIKREQLSSDYYQPLNRLIRVGPTSSTATPAVSGDKQPVQPSASSGQENGTKPESGSGQSVEPKPSSPVKS